MAVYYRHPAERVIAKALFDFWGGDVRWELADDEAEAVLRALLDAGYGLVLPEEAL